jgi:hypothetical protein
MRTRFVVGCLALGLVVLPAAAHAADTSVCKDGGWRNLVRADGTPFKNQGDCVSYVSKGGIPRPPGPPPETVLAVAYTNLDGTPGFGAGDQLIARFVDLDGNGPDEGDRVDMGRYPTAFSAPYGFADFGVTSHLVTLQADGSSTHVNAVSGVDEPTAYAHLFTSSTAGEFYSEFHVTQDPKQDRVFIVDSGEDRIEVRGSGGSAPTIPVDSALVRVDAQDDAFIDVDILID